jgi:hypothetical protein
MQVEGTVSEKKLQKKWKNGWLEKLCVSLPL